MTALTYALLAGILPSFIWLFFWLREDVDHPEPRYLIGLSFLGGALAVLIAIFAEGYVKNVIGDQTIRYIIWAAIEEIVKFAIIGIIALDTRFNDEPIDAMIYLITIALGFSAVENSIFLLEPFTNGQFVQGITTESMRFIGASLVHVVSSAIIGFSLGVTFYKSVTTKVFAAILGIAGAVTLHSMFNLFIINSNSFGMLRIFAWIWLSVIILLMIFEEIKAVKPKQTQIS